MPASVGVCECDCTPFIDTSYAHVFFNLCMTNTTGCIFVHVKFPKQKNCYHQAPNLPWTNLTKIKSVLSKYILPLVYVRCLLSLFPLYRPYFSLLNQCITSFSSIDHLLGHCAWFLILFHLTQLRFSRSTHPQMCLSLETLTSIRTGLPILVELTGLVNSVISFLSHMTLLRWLAFLLGPQTVILTVLLF